MALKRAKIDLRQLRNFQREFSAGLAARGGPVDDFFKQAAGRYLAMVRRRFVKLSRGGSASTGQRTWPPLRASTIRRRRGARRTALGRRRVAILRDTGTLFNALGEGSPGNVMRRMKTGIRVGIGGPAGHGSGSGLTIGELAVIHDQGRGRNPKREIIPAEFNAQTANGIRRDFKSMIGELGRRAQR